MHAQEHRHDLREQIQHEECCDAERRHGDERRIHQGPHDLASQCLPLLELFGEVVEILTERAARLAHFDDIHRKESEHVGEFAEAFRKGLAVGYIGDHRINDDQLTA